MMFTQADHNTPQKRRHNLAAYVYILVLLIVCGLVWHTLARQKPSSDEVAAAISEVVGSTPDQPDEFAEQETVCLDPGHGGNDVGAVYGKVYESNVNLLVAFKVKQIVEDAGYRAYLTREDDSWVDKRDRSAYCNSVSATVMVSIHHNSYSDHSVNYSTALYYADEDKNLASAVLNSTASELKNENKGISKFNNSLLWTAKMPAVLVEAFFITNKSDYALLKASDYSRLKTEAQGIASGIITYFANPELIETSPSNDSLEIDRKDLGD